MAHPFLDDPVLRLLPEEIPSAFFQFSTEEQAVRGRYFLMTWVVIRDIAYAWWVALGYDPAFYKVMKETVDGTLDDNVILAVGEAVAQDNAERQSEHVTQQ